MGSLEIHQFPCLQDNYGVLIHDNASGQTAAIDAPEAEPVRRALKEKGWKLSHILVTHHHADHTQGIEPLKAENKCTVIGPKAEAAKIKGLDRTVGEGDTFEFAGNRSQVAKQIGNAVPPLLGQAIAGGVARMLG